MSTSSPSSASYDRSSATRFPGPVDSALRTAGWEPGRWDIKQAEYWADALRDHTTPAGHRHTVFPAAVEAWAEFGGLTVAGSGPGRQIAPARVRLDPLTGLHLARTFCDLGRALSTELSPLGAETDGGSHLAIDREGRVYGIDHTGDWFLGASLDDALALLLTGLQPARLTTG
ncbi:SUKH-3 domain-containing protein [Streptomyces sp. NPDC060334]|uniref:SUKH-3 domain-containing protein n=1 Tax=unclassified Streptomyces TaxID=2593676 RepID=UPI0006AEB0C1|nr:MULTISPECIES: SUKH-3 domain-containing protein [unclassified Streptomyces]KOU52149.1 SUKH-3 domain containing protein [Streptomyces sp. WM4235]MCX5075009.1 SUKH-3 domain-containing protein [Streptomyces sp. NBC_00424]MCX5153373.1 SUKH-3 domain-containing protein [Streptomyces sp. NBC_00291]WUD41840.1 SUKH-3 domain-containing protein [Streptomyces sp. NBC_00513]